MIDTLLRDSDPARDLHPDAGSEHAQSLLAGIVAIPRDRSRGGHARTRTAGRRAVAGGLLTAAVATVVLLAPMPWDGHGPGNTASAYAVTTDGSGAVHVSVRWDRLRDPAALQAALDHAGARVTIVVRTGTQPQDCLGSAHVVGYDSRAVQWRSPGSADGGFTVRPADFPTGATFVVTVDLAPAGTPDQSTFAPSQPQLEGFSGSMVVGPIPVCAP